MKIGIIVYSETKNTLSVIEEIRKAFEAKGDTVNLIELQVFDVKKNKKLQSFPDVPSCDVLILASPVQAFSVARPMLEFLKKSTIKEQQKVYLVITQHFTKRWLGGNQALKAMKKQLIRKNVIVEKEVDIHWSSKNREIQINEAIKGLV